MPRTSFPGRPPIEPALVALAIVVGLVWWLVAALARWLGGW